MSEVPTPSGLSTQSEQAQKPTGLWRKTVAFLNRDVTSFLSGDHEEGVPETNRGFPLAGSRDQPAVVSLVDPSKLQSLAFRRAALDWRDNFQMEVTTLLSRQQDSLVQKMDANLGKTNLLRRFITQSAEEMMQDDFVEQVRQPLKNFLFDQEAKLTVLARQWGLPGTVELVFSTQSLQQECAVLRDVGFKPSNRALICARLHTVLMDRVGIADGLREQAHRLFRQLLEAHASC